MICSWRIQVNYSVRVPVCGEVIKFIANYAASFGKQVHSHHLYRGTGGEKTEGRWAAASRKTSKS